MNKLTVVKAALLSVVMAFSFNTPAVANHGSSAVILASAALGAASEGDKCVSRITGAGCHLSNNNKGRIRSNVTKCTELRSGSGKTITQVMILRNGKIVTVPTKGNNQCKPVKYSLGSGVKKVRGSVQMKVIQNAVWFLTEQERPYFMYSDGTTYELLNSKKKSYKGMERISGNSNGTAVVLHGQTFKLEVDRAKREDKKRKGQAKQVQYQRYSTFESLFRNR